MDSFAPLYLVGDRMLSHHYQIEGGIGEGGPDTAPSCPRCASPNTKFCYYNNYSLSQPRFLCKSCRRYWTKGGSLRNVPIGGGCRKSRRTKAAARKALRADNSPAPAGDNGLSSGPASGNEIDMATVFAKFLNQSTEYEEEKKFDDVALIQENLMENDENTLVIPDLVVGQGDLLWSDSTSPDLPEFMWQLESPFPSDEYWKVSIGDNWSSGFAFPGFDVLSNAE